jgi:hypothetical protein
MKFLFTDLAKFNVEIEIIIKIMSNNKKMNLRALKRTETKRNTYTHIVQMILIYFISAT